MVTETRELLVMGNGFDLASGLKTHYSDFFSNEYYIDSIVGKDKNKTEVEEVFKGKFRDAATEVKPKDKKNANGWPKNSFQKGLASALNEYDIKLPIEKANKDKNSKKKKLSLNNWDIVFMAAFALMSDDINNQDWCDVEKIILEVITTTFTDKDDTFTKNYFDNNENRELFIGLIRYIFRESRKSQENTMLDELQKFEKSFAEYIQNEKKNTESYYDNASKLLENITGSSSDNKVKLDVINFNYSLDESDANKELTKNNNIKINSWTNIHGIADWNKGVKRGFNKHMHELENQVAISAPIFGVDGHDILSSKSHKLDLNDPRIIFTKSFRLVDNNVNVMRDKKHMFQKNVDKIIFYGHSLDQADYSYFESIFDMYDIFNSDVELNFYYVKKDTSMEARVEKRETLKKVINLLNSYGEILQNQHGENIVNKLVLEQRLKLLPSIKVGEDKESFGN